MVAYNACQVHLVHPQLHITTQQMTLGFSQPHGTRVAILNINATRTKQLTVQGLTYLQARFL